MTISDALKLFFVNMLGIELMVTVFPVSLTYNKILIRFLLMLSSTLLAAAMDFYASAFYPEPIMLAVVFIEVYLAFVLLSRIIRNIEIVKKSMYFNSFSAAMLVFFRSGTYKLSEEFLFILAASLPLLAISLYFKRSDTFGTAPSRMIVLGIFYLVFYGISLCFMS